MNYRLETTPKLAALHLRSLLFVIFVCFFVIGTSVSASADDGYIKIGEATPGNTYSLHLASLEDRGEYLTCWVKVTNLTGDMAKPINKKKPHYIMQLWAAASNTKQIQSLSSIAYDENENIIDSYHRQYNPTNWLYCVPNSIGEAIWNVITDANFYSYLLERNRVEDY